MLLGKVVICLKKLKLDPYIAPCISINSKWIKEINIRPKNSEAITEMTREYSGKNRYSKDFLNRIPAAQQLRERMDKWDYMKLKRFCTTKEMVFKLK
jgi:hypothetical protein